jgi:hypothetical protein
MGRIESINGSVCLVWTSPTFVERRMVSYSISENGSADPDASASYFTELY